MWYRCELRTPLGPIPKISWVQTTKFIVCDSAYYGLISVSCEPYEITVEPCYGTRLELVEDPIVGEPYGSDGSLVWKILGSPLHTCPDCGKLLDSLDSIRHWGC